MLATVGFDLDRRNHIGALVVTDHLICSFLSVIVSAYMDEQSDRTIFTPFSFVSAPNRSGLDNAPALRGFEYFDN